MVQCKAVFELFRKLHMRVYAFICPFESGKCGKEEEKKQKFEYLENKKSFTDEIKNIFYSF